MPLPTENFFFFFFFFWGGKLHSCAFKFSICLIFSFINYLMNTYYMAKQDRPELYSHGTCILLGPFRYLNTFFSGPGLLLLQGNSYLPYKCFLDSQVPGFPPRYSPSHSFRKPSVSGTVEFVSAVLISAFTTVLRRQYLFSSGCSRDE